MNRNHFSIIKIGLLALLLMLLTSNAQAYSVSSGLQSITFQFVPAIPGSDMSLEWNNYFATVDAKAYYSGSNSGLEHSVWDSLTESSDLSVIATTDHSSISAGISNDDMSFAVNLDDGLDDYQHCNGNWSLRRDFTVHGAGWLLISAIHNAAFEENPPSDLDYYSYAHLYLQSYNYNMYPYYAENSSSFNENSSILSDVLGVGLFFDDGDSGYFRTWLNNSVDINDYVIPLPGAVWLFSTGLLAAAAGFRKRNH